MIILKRWRALLGWAFQGVLAAWGVAWAIQASSAPLPGVAPYIILFIFACAGARYCVDTMEAA